jgi:hypothetical protein
MFNTSTIVLNPEIVDISLENFSPFVLNIDPSKTEPSKKTYKIVYDFNDGSDLKTILLAASAGKTNSDLPFPFEPGDPRNVPVSHTFYLPDETIKSYNISISSFPILDQFIGADGFTNYTHYTISLSLSAPFLDSASASISGNFFEELHLVNTRMFGPNNTILYNFEGFNPYYLLPTIVEWHEYYDGLNKPPFLFDPEFSPRGRYKR